MSVFKKSSKDVATKAGTYLGDFASQNVRTATDVSIDGMELFQTKADQIANVAFEKAKGNLFEYIEAAKFNAEAANAGSKLSAVVTEAVGRPHDPADIEILKENKVVRQVQAKFSDSKKAASDSINMQRKAKYQGMQRLIRKEENYADPSTGQTMSLLEKAKNLSKQKSEIEGNIYQSQYKDVYDNLTDELNHDGISSGGTTLEEVQAAYNNPLEYIDHFERKAVANEMKASAANMAKASFVTAGIVSGTINMFAVFRDEKSLTEALHDVGADAVKSGLRGGATGIVSTAIRYKGIKAGSALLSDSTAATVMAGGLIDGGVALLSYARGEISAIELKDELIDTTVKATSTIFFTKAVTTIMGKAVSPFIPMAVYTAASLVITSTREIIKNAKLQTEEYDRMTAILQDATRTANEYHEQFQNYIDLCESKQREMLNEFINSFSYNLETGENYDQALFSIVRFAERAGIELQHIDFEEFRTAMRNNDSFVLR